MIATSNSEESLTSVKWLAIIFWLFYALAIPFQESWWGMHHYTFLSSPIQGVILTITLLLIIIPDQMVFRILIWGANRWKIISTNRTVLISIVSLFFVLVYYNLHMYASLYGDAIIFRENLGTHTTQYHPEYLKHLLSFNFLNLKTGNTTILSLVRLSSLFTGMTHQKIFYLLSSFSGGLYIFIWLHFVRNYFRSLKMKWLVGVIGIFAPFTQFFFGHEEIYAPILLTSTAFLCSLLWCLRKASARNSILSFILLFLCLKLHGSCLIFIIPYGLVYLHNYHRNSIFINDLFQWKNLLKWILFPAFIAGGYLYFVHLADYNDPRTLGSEIDIFERLFLPIAPPQPPLDRYTLLHPNHFWDYFNMIFLWSASILMIIMISVISYPAKINWGSQEIQIIGITLIFTGFIFFAFNPLLSMPMDMDLFSLVGPVFLVFGVALLKQWENFNYSIKIFSTTLALSIFSLCIFWVNSDKELLSQRQESTGKYIFKTYWIHSAGDIEQAIDLMPESDSRYLSRYLKVINDLEPYAIIGKDPEFANLLWYIGKYYRTNLKDYEKALIYHQRASLYDENAPPNYVGLMESNYFLNNYDEAFTHSLKLVELEYPDKKKAFRIAIDCGIQAKQHLALLDLTEQYLKKWQDEDITALNHELKVLVKRSEENLNHK